MLQNIQSKVFNLFLKMLISLSSELFYEQNSYPPDFVTDVSRFFELLRMVMCNKERLNTKTKHPKGLKCDLIGQWLLFPFFNKGQLLLIAFNGYRSSY